MERFARQPEASGRDVRMSELLGALSHALDLTEGQADGHCIRCCWIGIHIGREIGLSDHEIWELYYTLLLKDLGCSSNAARICQLYLADDLTLKHDFKLVGGGLPQVLKFVVSHAGADGSLADRLRTVLDQMKNGDRYVHEVIETRCHRGADIARQMRFSEGVALGIQGLDEHWDGGGQPYGLKGEQIPVYARIALLAQVVDVFNSSGGPASARAEARRRAGKWFDPALDEAFTRVSATDAFWHRLAAPDLDRIVLDLEPAHQARPVDDDFLDEIAAAFAQVVDSKSPYTAGHSERVALITDLVATELGVDVARRRWLGRAALLHDIGKLGVSNRILDKAGKPTEAEWEAIKRHPAHTEMILSRIGAFADMAEISAAHHERLDGKGYPKGRAGDEIAFETRILTVADIYEAMTADRPYRAGMPSNKALEIMSRDVGTAIDARCFEALQRVVGRIETIQDVRGADLAKAS